MEEESSTPYLLIIGDRQALSWILREQRTAFPEKRCRTADRLRVGDRLVLYTTRGCFHKPTTDRGRVIGTATVATPVRPLDTPVEFAGRSFSRGCDLKIGSVTPAKTGPELAAMLGELETFPQSWATHLRRPLVPLNNHDYDVLTAALRRTTEPRKDVMSGYIDQAERTTTGHP